MRTPSWKESVTGRCGPRDQTTGLNVQSDRRARVNPDTVLCGSETRIRDTARNTTKPEWFERFRIDAAQLIVDKRHPSLHG